VQLPSKNAEKNQRGTRKTTSDPKWPRRGPQKLNLDLESAVPHPFRAVCGKRGIAQDSMPSACYTVSVQNEQDFRSAADAALSSLKRHLIAREEDEQAAFEVEEQGGVLNILFEDPAGRFVITPNAPVRQIWISALATSFKLDWDAKQQEFVLPRTAETLRALVDRLIGEQHAPNASRI
jgi:CyaY protein